MRGILICLSLLVLGVACPAFAASAAATEASSYESDMEAFVGKIDREYPFFALKGIGGDWADAKKNLVRRAKACTSDEAFLRIIIDAVRVLRDGHMGIQPAKAKLPALPPQYYPGLSLLPATDGRVAVMYPPRALAGTLATGVVVTKIDGVDARRHLEQRSEAAWRAGGFFSSPQRARLFEYRLALRGEQGRKYTIAYLDGDEERTVTLECDVMAQGWPHTYNMPGDLKRVGRSFYYAKLGDDVGYMYLRRAGPSVVEGIDEALEAHANLEGWIVDLRGNGGGGYDRNLIDRIKRFPRPVAVVIDAGCVSAGETLARDFRRYADAQLFGSKSGGSSSSKRTWSLPSGIASIRFSVRSRWRHDRKPIEFNGIDPDVRVEAVPTELQAGNNSAILRAQEYIVAKAAKQDVRKPDQVSDSPEASPAVGLGQDSRGACSEAESKIRVSGTVRAKDGSPVEGVRVRCFYLGRGIPWEFGRQLTDEDGRYVFEVRAGRPYWVEAGGRKATFAESERYATEPETDVSVENLVVRPFSTRIKGRIVFDNGQPAANLDYGYVSESASPIDPGEPPKTDSNGEFVIHCLPDEPYSFWVFVGKSTFRVWKRLDPKESVLELTLRKDDYVELPEDWLRGGFTHQAIAGDMVYAENAVIDFALPDLTGKVVSLSDLRANNKAVVVNITGTWCGGCRLEAPYLAEFYNRYRAKGLEVVSIAFEPTPKDKALGAIRAFKKKYDVNYTVLYGGRTKREHVQSVIPGLKCFGGYPTTIYVDRRGKVQFVHSGFYVNTEAHKKWQLDLMERHIRSILSSGGKR